MKQRQLIALCFDLQPAGEDRQLPQKIMIVPAPDADGYVRGKDGRQWRLTPAKAAALAAAVNSPLSITENHAGRLAAPVGGSSPAFAWIESAETDANGAIHANVKWTPRGEQAYLNRDYRFISPEFAVRKNSDEIEALVGAALVNDPNFTQLALNSAEFTQELSMNFAQQVRAALGLKETDTDEAAIVAINALKSDKQVALNAAENPPADKFVPRPQYDLALNNAKAAQTELAAIKAAQADAAINTEIEAALNAGKIAPATKDFYVAMCRKEGGLEEFRKFISVAPVIAGASSTKQAALGEGTALNADEKAVAAVLGVPEEKYLAERTRLRAAGLIK